MHQLISPWLCRIPCSMKPNDHVPSPYPLRNQAPIRLLRGVGSGPGAFELICRMVQGLLGLGRALMWSSTGQLSGLGICTFSSTFMIYGSECSFYLQASCSQSYIQTSPSRWQGWTASTSRERLKTYATFLGAYVCSFLTCFYFFDMPLQKSSYQLKKIFQSKFKIPEQSFRIFHIFLMSTSLAQKIQQSRQQALAKGTVIKLRKEDIAKTKLLGSKFTYTWYQTPSKIGIQIPHIVERKEELQVKFGDDKLKIKFPIKNTQQIYELQLVLFRNIVGVRSKVMHRLDSIEIVMEKKVQSQTWPFLRRDGLGIPEAESKKEISYPSSSKVRKNWDKIDKEIEGELITNGKEYGQDPSMSFFKQIFDQGDPEKRRAMMKSFQTSGGTVLSTDWADVSKKDYEGKDRPSPPKGQEWRKPEI